MNSGYLFILSVLIFAFILLLWQFRTPAHMVTFFKTRAGLGVLKGIVLFVAFGVVAVLISKAFADDIQGKWLSYGAVYLGIDSTFNQSPQCQGGENSDKLTSSGGLIANIYESGDGRFEANATYQHHSCAFNPDARSYDAAGIKLQYRLWDR